MFRIFDGRDFFYQWGLDRKLIVDDTSIVEVHFCNKTGDCSLVCETYLEGGLTVVDVPNILLQDDWRIFVYAYDSSYTKFSAEFDVMRRTRPADYVYTETEVKTFDALEKRVESLEEKGIPQERLAKSIEDYFIENPIDVGATDEEVAQIEKNRSDIIELQNNEKHYALKSEVPSINGLASEDYVDSAIDDIDFSSYLVAPTVAEVGQYFKISAIDDGGKITAIEAVDAPKGTGWRYIGRLEMTEEVVSMVLDVDEDGKPFTLQEVCVRGVLMPNTVPSTGWIRPHINGLQIPETTMLMGLDAASRTVGRAFCFTVVVRDGSVFLEEVSTGSSNANTWSTLADNNAKYGLITAMPTAEAIKSVGIGGYQTGVIGIGTYFEVWGVDA